ncbi:hypothetical protein KSP39_PZI020258 [Platanthera zijinensis]|uniref:Uncharacterized protein n=1 Tax=Platanthera zijinensis TaxID=2320716 RepID=A0AAP0B0G7_9ASPA
MNQPQIILQIRDTKHSKTSPVLDAEARPPSFAITTTTASTSLATFAETASATGLLAAS